MKDQAAIIVVTYNSREVIDACLDAAVASGAEVIVVENASADGTAEAVRRHAGVRLIRNSVNRGFAGGVNQGVAACRQPFLLLLNPDTVFQGGLDALMESASLPGAGASCGRLLDMNGVFQRGFSVRRLLTPLILIFETLGLNRLWPSNPVNRRYRYLDFDANRPGEVEQPAGAFLMLRRKAFDALGGFDEGFHPVWFEDVDFCKRLIANGFSIRFDPRAAALHSGGHSVGQLTVEGRTQHWYGSLLRYSAKHHAGLPRTAVAMAVICSGILRLGGEIFVRRSPKTARIYAKVIRLACRYLFSRGGGDGVKNGTGRDLIDQAQIHVL